MNRMQTKLENPVRLEELQPKETLKRIGLRNDQIICDIGAGSGIFTIAASEITQNKVYALDINEDLLSVIAEKAHSKGLANIEIVKVADGHFAVDSGTADLAILVTVLHEIQNKTHFLAEVKRILKLSGRLAVIEFHKRVTPMGPPVAHRLGKEDLRRYLQESGFASCDEFDLGDNFYCVIFQSVV